MDILYSDIDIVVCVKPVGLDSENKMPETLSAELGGPIFTVHRLDLNVGGVVAAVQFTVFADIVGTLGHLFNIGDGTQQFNVNLIHSALSSPR